MIFYFLDYECLKIWSINIEGEKISAYISR